MLDNTLVINRLLTQDEINGLYNGGAGTEDLALVETPVHIATRYITGKKGISRKDLRKMKNTFPKISYKDQREMSLDFPRINKKDADLMKDDSREIMKDWE